jgi:hypothetical protein
MALTYIKHEKISLRTHPQFNEAWLHDRICEEPAILGLGDVHVVLYEGQTEECKRQYEDECSRYRQFFNGRRVTFEGGGVEEYVRTGDDLIFRLSPR